MLLIFSLVKRGPFPQSNHIMLVPLPNQRLSESETKLGVKSELILEVMQHEV